MSEPKLTDQAEPDLDKAWTFLAVQNRRAADRLIDAIWKAARRQSKLHIRKRDGDKASLVAATILNWFTDELIQTWSFFVDLSSYLLVRRVDHTDFAQFSFWSCRCKPAEHAH